MLYMLHILLISMHIVLLVICKLRIEERVFIPLSEHWIGRTSTAMTVVATIFATLYIALLVWLTQRLAMQRLLVAMPTTASGIHDEFNAWIGLGSALMTLLNQFSVKTAAKWVFCITTYLVNMSILHVTIPAMFTVKTGTIYIANSTTSRLAYPHVYDLIYKGYHMESSDGQAILGGASSLLPYLALQDYGATIGLANATMYDRLAANDGALNTTVNATTFDVTCGSLASLQLTSNVTDPYSGEVTSYTVSHIYPNGTQQRDIDVAYLAQNNTMVFTQHDVSENRHYNAENRSFYIYGTFNIRDSTGKLLPRFQLPQRFNHTRNISMIGCNIYSYNHTIKVDTQRRLPLLADIPNLRNTSNWFAWEPQPLVSPNEFNLLDLWTRAFREQYTTSLALSGTAASSIKGSPHLGFMERRESDSEGSVSSVPHLQARSHVQLHDLENALRRLAAAYFWSFNQIDATNRYGIERTATIPISIPKLVPQLQLNEIPICIGLAVSLILVMTCQLLLSGRSGRKQDGKFPDTLGLLQFLWLVRRSAPDVEGLVGDVSDPSEVTLRRKCTVELAPYRAKDTRGETREAALIVVN
ncbi:hypothetical protein EV714DRAFT_206955 [Schizophyllum commune]